MINGHLGGHLVRILILFGYKLVSSVRFQLHSNNLRKKTGLRHYFPYHTIFLYQLSSILDAILDISKCSMMPEWHHSDFSRTMCALPESTKKKSLKSSSRPPLNSPEYCRTRFTFNAFLLLCDCLCTVSRNHSDYGISL